MRTILIFILCVGLPHAGGAPALNWQEGAGFRSLQVSPKGRGEGFTLLPSAASGVHFTNQLSEQRHLTNQILLNGSGVAAGDVDGDGWTDLYFCALDGANALYRNWGNWKFEEVASAAGVACEDLTTSGAALADLDGDGDLDLVVNSVGQGTHIFHNDGKGRFKKSERVLNEDRGGMSMALGDLDGDGYLDLYVANYRTLGLMDIPNARATFKTIDGKPHVETFNGRPTTAPDLTNRFTIGPRGAIEENGEPDLILRNKGGLGFEGIPMNNFLDEDGKPLGNELFGWGLAVAIRDINEDGLPDIYVCNDFQTEDRCWIQQKDGRFRLIPALALRRSSLFSMAVDFADVNRDGRTDFFVADMLSREHSQRMRDMIDSPPIYNIGEIANRPQYSFNTLFLNRGDETFAEIARLSRVDATDWSWGCVFLDVDLDGWEDLLICNGMERAARDLDVAAKMKAMRAGRQLSDAEIFQARKAFPRFATANVAFRNRGDLTFEDASAKWNFNLNGVSHGMALADLDNDGDLDVAVNNLNAAAAIYRNESGAARVAVRLKGAGPNTRGIGAKIFVRAAGFPAQSQEMMAGGRYLSSDDPIRAFAAGAAKEVAIEVRWRGGKTTRLEGLEPNCVYEIDESSAQFVERSETEKGDPATWFEDVSERLGLTHPEEPFDDFARQPLLPRKLSQGGPIATWADLDGDGWKDLVIGGSKNQPLAIFRNDQKRGFQPMNAAPFNRPMKRDVGDLLAVRMDGKTPSVLASLSNYEDALGYGAAVLDLRAETPAATEIAGSWDSSAGAMCAGDFDQNGDADLFVAGEVGPGSYPAAASSRLFRNENGRFVAVEAAFVREIGLVKDAEFFDADGDGDADLLLACEWGPMRLFENDGGQFADATEKFGLDRYQGLWQRVAIGDFDEDGRLDFAASNWGRNTKYDSQREKPVRIYSGDFDEDGTFDIIEAHYDPALQKYVPDRQLGAVGGAIQFVNARFRSNAAYGNAGVEEILGDRLDSAAIVEANWLETTAFLNRGGKFEARALPVEAQFAPAFGLCAADFDGDKHLDIVLAQNFFAVQPETPRYDGGRSLLLKGDGKGNFATVPGQVSGLRVYGEQRSVAAADYDKDGWMDLVITQNGAEVKLYRNRGAGKRE